MPQTDHISLTVNGVVRTLAVGGPAAEVEASDTLAHTLRETLGLTGTKVSCDRGACGACTVLMDGEAVLSCMLLTVECAGRHIVTVEGLAGPETGALDPLQQAFIDHTAFQCGYCTPGILMSARALLDHNPHPAPEEVREALSGNFCRCITHYHVLEAIEAVVRDTRTETASTRATIGGGLDGGAPEAAAIGGGLDGGLGPGAATATSGGPS